jgi:hypothetical protein
MPAVRQIVRNVAADGNRFEAMVYNIVLSNAFLMREQLSTSQDESAPQQASL